MNKIASLSMTQACIYGAGLLLLGLSLYIHYTLGYIGDKNMELVLTRMWLSGKKLYVDIFAVTLPLIFMVYALPVAVSERFAFIQDYQALSLFGFVIVACSIALARRIMAGLPWFKGAITTEFTALGLFVFICYQSPHYFMDRENLFLTLVFPYLVLNLPSLPQGVTPARWRLLSGILAGIGFCIKPHCFIIWAAVQVARIFRDRTIGVLASAENLVIYVIVFSYAGWICLFLPDYISTVLPMAMATYSAASFKILGLYYTSVALLNLGVTFVEFRLRYHSPFRRDIFYLLFVCLAFFIYALTNNGWSYTYNPMSSMILLTTGWVFWDFRFLKNAALPGMSDTESKRFTFGMRGCAAIFLLQSLFCVVTYGGVIKAHCDRGLTACQDYSDVLPVLQTPGHTRSFGTISMDFDRWSSVVRVSGASWDTRFFQLWMLPKLIGDEHFARQHAWIFDYVASGLADDMNRRKPEVMFVDDSDHLYTIVNTFNLIVYLSANVKFKEAWEHYHYSHSINACPPRPDRESTSAKVPHKCSIDIYYRSL